mmetsp:Transcript_20176/g.27267  ORF Transcript_20176/g.27267 Transcript_20176/m.27267 type:complete len:108 (+) Transcript_20176:370-693(+)
MRCQPTIIVKQELCKFANAIALITVTAAVVATARDAQPPISALGMPRPIQLPINCLSHLALQIGHLIKVNGAILIELDPVEADAELSGHLVQRVAYRRLIMEGQANV